MRTESSGQAGKRRGKRGAARKSASHDAIAMLKQDHEEVMDMFEEFESLKEDEDTERCAELVNRICSALTVHTTLEEELFYPAVRAAVEEDDLMDEALVEHDSAKALIEEIQGMQPGDGRYNATVTVLCEYVKHHVQEEQKEMFPKAKKAKIDLESLGEEMATRKQELESAQGSAAEKM